MNTKHCARKHTLRSKHTVHLMTYTLFAPYRFRDSSDVEFDALNIEPSTRWPQSVDAHENVKHVEETFDVDGMENDVLEEGVRSDIEDNSSLEEGELVSDTEDEHEATDENKSHEADVVPLDMDPADVTSWLVLDETRASDTPEDEPREDVIDQEGGARTAETQMEEANEDPFADDDDPDREVGLKTARKHFESFTYKPKGSRQTLDLEYFLERIRGHLYDDLSDKLKRGGVRFGIAINVQYYTPLHDMESTPWLRSGFLTILHPVELERTIDAQFVRIIHAHANYCKDQTGNTIDEIMQAVLETASYFPKPGGHHYEVPEKLARKKAIVNIETNDGTCFGYSVLACLYRGTRNANRKSTYWSYWYPNHLDEIRYPVDLAEIPNIEQLI